MAMPGFFPRMESWLSFSAYSLKQTAFEAILNIEQEKPST